MTHLDLDALADLLAAEGTPEAEAHVASCAGCAGRLDELAAAEVEVAAVLASLPAPPLPAGLAERLQSAFDAEPALVPAPSDEGPVALGTGARAVGAGGSATVTPFPTAGRRAPRAWLPAAAAVAVLAVGGAVLVPALSGGGSGDESATSAAGSAGGGSGSGAGFGDLTRNETGTDYAADGTLAAALPALVGGSAGAVVAPLAEAGGSEQAAPEAASVPGGEAVADAPASALGGGDADTSSRVAAPDPALDRLRTPEGLASCLSALLPAEEPDLRPLAVDYAAYAGEPALVVVLPATGGAPKVDVFVVGAGCTAGDDRTLFFTRLDRP